MSILEDYEQAFGLTPLSPDDVARLVDSAMEHILGCLNYQISAVVSDSDRVLLWMDALVRKQAERLGQIRIPENSRCSYCLTAAGGTDEAWMALPSMTIDEGQAHAQECEHNPLVRRVRELEAQLEELRGRAVIEPASDARRALAVEADGLRSGRGGWGGRSPQAMAIAAAIDKVLGELVR